MIVDIPRFVAAERPYWDELRALLDAHGRRAGIASRAPPGSASALSVRTLLRRPGAPRHFLHRPGGSRAARNAGVARLFRNPRNPRAEEDPLEGHPARPSARLPAPHGSVPAGCWYHAAGRRIRMVRHPHGSAFQGRPHAVPGTAQFACRARSPGRDGQQGPAQRRQGQLFRATDDAQHPDHCRHAALWA